MTVFELFGFRAVRQREKLMSKAYPECGYLRGNKLTQRGNSLGVFGWIARSVGQHYPIGIERLYLFRGGIAWHYRHIAAAVYKLSADIEFISVIHQHHVESCVLGGEELLLLYADLGNYTTDGIGAYLIQNFLFIEIPRGDCAVHYAAFANNSGKAAGIYIINTDYPIALEISVKLSLAAEV